MNKAIVIRFPPSVRLVEPKVEQHPSDAEWERRWREGVARRIARKVYDMPVPMFLRRQCG